MQAKHVLIIGGGIGGLGLAVVLRNNGIKAEVFEKTSTFREIGSGLVLSPNGMKAIDRLGCGIGGEVRKIGYVADPTALFPFLAWNGKVKFAQTFGDLAAKYGTPMVSIHRAELHALLHHALGDVGLHVNAKLLAFRQHKHGVTACFEDGCEVSGDVLVGADGLHSAVRAQLLGPEKPRYLGMSSIRGVVQGLAHPYGRSGFLTMGPGVQIFASPLGNGRLYWVVTINAEEGTWPKYTAASAKMKLLKRLAKWHAPVVNMIEATDPSTLVMTDIHDRKPIKHWSSGCVTLLGDAAHPMSPFVGQGANMALEDAIRLADCLHTAQDLSAAFLVYEQTRFKRTTRMVNQSRLLGKMGQIENPIACWGRDRIMSVMLKFADQEKQDRWLYEYTP
jgi:2-polyprenyl-6-methoxyphenol hydroxylase-like FAD-dependent oxidoreductase